MHRTALFVSDCIDPNAEARYATAAGTILEANVVQFAPITGTHGVLAASLTIVDTLDVARMAATLGCPSQLIILANAAPRSESSGIYPNGVPFGYFRVGANALVVTTFTPELLHMSQRLGLVSAIEILDIPRVMEWALRQRLVIASEAEEIIHTQFRSLRFAPLVASFILAHGMDVPSDLEGLKSPPPHMGRVMRIDGFTDGRFANLYSGLTLNDIRPEYREGLLLWDERSVKVYHRLADVPPGELAVVVSSSGYDLQRLLMVTIQGGNAARRLGIDVGAQLIHPSCVLRS